MSDYSKDVVDVGDEASKLAAITCNVSYKNSPAVEVVTTRNVNFRSFRGWRWKKHILRAMLRGKIMQTLSNDGAGGKPQFHTLLGLPETFRWLGWEIITMCADDDARNGGFPVIMCNDVNIKNLTPENIHLFEHMMLGFGEALKESGLVNITGETAIMKHSVTAFCDVDDEEQLVLNWAGACIGLAHIDKVIDGSKIEPGMPIVGLVEDGYRCNGGTFFTNLIKRKWKLYNEHPEAIDFVKRLCIPSKSYARLIAKANGWNPDGSVRKPLVKMTGIAHITGGGVWHKFGEILPPGVGAVLDNIPRNNLLAEAQELAQEFPDLTLSDYDMYGTFHGGCGMLVVCETINDAHILKKLARDHNIKSTYVGPTIESPDNEILIASKYYRKLNYISSEKG